jgi:Tol biopolymer transport system component/predicted Ser/Thr protein kinase
MPLTPGARLGAYEVLSAIGAGGMGEVYRARDTRLGRTVALKILPETFAADADRVARFEREAQILAALNHPHIAQIYGLEDRALVMELVDGSTLEERLLRGPIPVDETLSIARQIAEALQAAHDKGIVHRDLKPANIALTADNTVKVLDFGLAKLSQADDVGTGFDVSQSPTITSPAMMTGIGMILGTAAYMAPEQAKGRAVDKRADVWAFGCVLYEMLTGKRLFAGDDVSDTFAFILTKDPDWSALPSGATPGIRTVLERCLTKDLRQRAGDMSLVRFLLEPQSADVTIATGAGHGNRRRERIAWAAAIVAGAIASWLGVVHFFEVPPSPPSSVRFAIAPPPGMTLATGVVSGGGALSPDGRQLVLPAAPRDGASVRLIVHRLDTNDVLALPGTEGAIGPFWSPDSRFVAFLSAGKLQRVDVSGGPPQVVCDANGFAGGTWSSDGTIVFATGTGPLLRVPARGGNPVPVTALDASHGETAHRYPWFLPEGRDFLYIATAGAGGNMVRVGSLDSKSPVSLMASDSRATYADGYVLHVTQGALLAQRFDPSRLTTSGEPMVVARNVSYLPSTATADFSTSATGLLSFRSSAGAVETQLAWVDRAGRLIEKVGTPADQTYLSLSPDGKRLAISVFDITRRARDIWIHDLVRGVRTRFTLNQGENWASAWSPDGSRLAFSVSLGGILDMFEKSTNGAGSESRVGEAGGNNKYVRDWTPDGNALLFATGRSRSQTGNDVWLLPLGKDRSVVPVLMTRFNEDEPIFSPDGHWVAYSSDESGRIEIYVTPYPGPGGKWQVSKAGGTDPVWARNGRALYYLEGTALIEVALTQRGETIEVGTARRLFEARFRSENYLGYGPGRVFQISPDGQRFLIDIVESDAAFQTPITIVTNWTSLLAARRE